MSKERVFELIRAGNAVLWAGAGLSVYAGYPSGYGLRGLLLDQIRDPAAYRLSDSSPLVEVADAFVTNSTRHHLNRFLQSVFNVPPKSTKLHERIAAIPHFRSIVTTNYDTLFERAFGVERINLHLDDLDITYSDHRKIDLFKVHGCVNHPEKFIISKRDYDNFFIESLDKTPYWSVIRERLMTRPIVFLGYGLADDNINLIIERLFRILGNHRTEYYLIAPGWSIVDQMELFSKNIKYIDMSADEFISELEENLKDNIYQDYKSDIISAEIFEKFVENYQLKTQFFGVTGADKITNLIPISENPSISFSFKTFGESSEGLFEYLSSKEPGELVLRDAKDFSISWEGIKENISIDEIVIKPAPTIEFIGDIRFSSGVEGNDLNFQVFLGVDKSTVKFSFGTLDFVIDALHPEGINFDDGKLSVKWTCKHGDTCSTMKNEIEYAQFLCALASAETFHVFKNGQPFVQLTLGDRHENVLHWKNVYKYFSILRMIEIKKLISFSSIKYSTLNDQTWKDLNFVDKAFGRIPVEQNMPKTFEMMVSEDYARSFSDIISDGKSRKVFFVHRNETVLEIHENQVVLGFATVEVVEPIITVDEVASKDGLVKICIASSFKKQLVTFSDERFQDSNRDLENVYIDILS